MSKNTCYMCDEIATTVEHAPPKCLFPEKKDLRNSCLDLKKNLITVPSCEKHNTAKSTDDEYLLYLLSMSITSGDDGLQQFLTKVQRAWKRKPQLINNLLKNAQPILIQDNLTKTTYQTVSLDIDTERVYSSLESCARALYFKEFQQKFLGNVTVTAFFIRNLDPKFNNDMQTFERIRDGLFADIEPNIKAENPLVFTYKFYTKEGMDNVLLEMTFYEGGKAVASFKK